MYYDGMPDGLEYDLGEFANSPYFEEFLKLIHSQQQPGDNVIVFTVIIGTDSRFSLNFYFDPDDTEKINELLYEFSEENLTQTKGEEH